MNIYKIEKPIDTRKNTTYDEVIKGLYARGFNANQIWNTLHKEGAKIGYATVYRKVKAYQEGKETDDCTT